MKIDKIIRAKRKTISMHVTDSGTLIVRAPFGVNEETINNVITKHKNWIEKKKKEILSRYPKPIKKSFVNDEDFPYLGKYYKLSIVDDQKDPLIFNNGFFLSKEHSKSAKDIFTAWYKEKAHEVISERVEWHAKNNRFTYSKVRITNAKKRWGSCSPLGNLNFSWRLVMAPLPVIDYVVVHELVHLEEKNHAKTFWSKVKILMPDYEKHKKWLKRNGYLLRL
ncbi:MAG: M48 family metallopeptidase [Candidatus Aenigmarchaeota archaeon]|nr:M48 family metallopeptidase [Candidatus Aenigmarchaeota archaeon]